ncbi:low specificity L-threonine aldolase [Phyllobacterium sp. 0TCS1.6C]|uniref:threonine aldolase family protein n=1 Tax=unclassified Phyllobacterium TaxID=2638441 RepID=UPI0022647191|nr:MULTISPECIES: low specificity L-threonine aldolase [unclassified Phyllobacterium]MCX8280994.1 low specificity L-threonine aldolase [Phyllobacterium sp. 0TCS1.6C]MCX8295860.1 low specificity L-threonine aldolase [Phyllobacterium sp. 0TCS1.6A]
MQFASDNWAGAHEKITENLGRHAQGFASAYGTSEIDRAVDRRFSEIFERDVAVFFVATGTAANSLAQASISVPGGVTFAHSQAHIITDEGGAPGFLSAGARFQGVDGELGRIDRDGLRSAIDGFAPGNVHAGQPMGVSITQATEIGTLYELADIAAIAAICREKGLPLHMDGARFANALVTLNCSAADMTWRQGVDILSFGGTKNGCWCAEALVFMNPEHARQMPFIRKRAAQLFSKSRFIAAQFEAYLADGLWLELAAHANAMAAALAERLDASRDCRLAWQPQANEVFAIIPGHTAAALREKGAIFHEWSMPGAEGQILRDGEKLVRLVTSFATSPDEIDRFGDLIK